MTDALSERAQTLAMTRRAEKIADDLFKSWGMNSHDFVTRYAQTVEAVYAGMKETTP